MFCVNTLIAQNITGQSEVNSIACNGGVATWNFTTDATTSFSYQVQTFSSGNWANFGSSVTVILPANFTVSNLFAGQFRIILFDLSSMPSDTSDLFMVNQPAPLFNSFTNLNSVSCFGGNNGTATVNPNGGTAPYTYLWSNGSTNNPVTGLSVGTYTCTITDANACPSITVAVAVTQPSSALTAPTPTKTNVSCFGGNNGTATANPSGGTAPYTYLWSNGSTNNPATDLSVGTYTCTITDANGCVNTPPSVTVTQPLVLTATTTKTNVNCFGGNDGSTTAFPSGGTAPYTYLWSNGQTTQTVVGLSVGIYTCIITDANGCTKNKTVTITQPSSALTASTPTKTNVTCFGGSDGTATANSSGGTASYTYLWSNGSTNNPVTGLSVGTYTCTITDANGCIFTTPSVAITQPLALVASSSATSVSCFGGSNGTATANPDPIGSPAPYTYLWSPGAQITQTATGLSAGIYTCTITDANGCIASTLVTLTQPQLLQVQINATEVSCNGGSDAIATALPSGGTAPYNYTWFNGTTTPTVTGLSAANYSVTVTDANNCPDVTATILINEPLVISAIVTIDSVSCLGGDDGEIILSVNGGNSPYTYLWSNTQTSQNATGLVAGNYLVAIYDATCNSPTFISAVVYEPSTVLSATATVIDATCFGASSGSITVNPIGGTPLYNYSWSNGQNSQVLTNQAFGIYDCFITDYNGCTTSVQATIDQPQALILSLPPTVSTSCFGYNDGSASVIPQGGTAPYTYFWSNGQTLQTAVNLVAGLYSVMVSDANNCLTSDTLNIGQPVQISANLIPTDVLCNGDTSGNIIISNVSGTVGLASYLWSNGNTSFFNQNLGAGTYYVTVTDTNGCFNTFHSTVLEPSSISAVLSYSDISVTGANDGNISVNISGGTSPYSYYWTSPNSYSSNNASINGLESGVYILTVTDAYGCSKEFIQVINEPNCNIFISQTYTAPLCYGTSASVYWQNNGGLAPYSNTLTNSDGIVLINGAQYQSPNVAVQLPNGVYNLVVTDAAGCLGLWNIDVIAPDPIIVDLTLTDALCNGSNDGTATAVVSGGSGSYNIDWGGSNPNLLTAGSYNMEVSDANGCSSGIINYTIEEPSQLVIDSVSTTEISCSPGGSDGTATIYGSGGVLPYTYSWPPTGQTSQMAQSLTNGNYIAYLYDANNCQDTTMVQIVNAPALNLTIQPTEISCIGLNDGALSATVISGSGPMTYLWSENSSGVPLSSDSFVSNLSSGVYDLFVSDVNNCHYSASISLVNPISIWFLLNANDITSNGANDGWINTISLSGGQSPYSYYWIGPNGFTAISQNLATLESGTYTLTVTDANGCQFSQSEVINEPGCNLVVTVNTTQPLCNGDNGSITWSNSGGSPSYQHVITDLTLPLALYNGFGSTGSFSLSEGFYTLEVTDQYGCSDLVNITITEPASVIANYTTSDVSCFGGSDGEIIVNPSGGTGIYTINYGFPNPSQLSVGMYSFTLSDDNGCQSVPFLNNFVIDEPNDIIVTTISTPVSCFNGNDGTATVTAIGGTLPYSYFWQGSGATTSSLNNLSEGVYYVTATDSNFCNSTVPVVVSEPSTYLDGSIIPTHVSCYGEDDGMASANPSGGTAPYFYLWSNGQTLQTVFGLSAGTYTCTITDANGCVTTLNGTINEPDEILSGLNTIPASCYGFSDGSASVNPTGGTGAYDVLWFDNTTNLSISSLPIGSYTVIVTDSDGCTTTSSPVIFNISQADSLTVTASELNGTSCYGGSNGSATVIVAGGTPNYNYTWLDSLGNVISINSNVNGLSEASYSVIVNDSNGCTDTAQVVIFSTSQLLANILTTPASCFGGSDGSATAYPSGGTPPYSYLWTGGQSTDTTNLDYTSLNAAITYYFSMVDNNGCTIYNEPVNISEPLPISMNFSGSDYNGFNVSCFDSSDADITVEATGGISPYEFSEQNILYTTDSTFTNISSGWFYAYVKDANGCVLLDSVEVTSPAILDPNISVINSLTCSGGNDGQLAAIPQGGVGPYTYFWPITFSISNTITGLTEASYTVDVTDINNCTASETFVLTSDFEITSTTFTTLVSCTGASDGTAVIQASGGTSPYSYSWNDGSINFSTNDTIAGLSPGLYACTITDANGCIGYDTINIIESTTSLVIDSSLTNSVSCFGGSDGSAIVYTSGGIGNYIYQWDDSNSQTTQQAVGLIAGTFIVTVTDSALCTVTETVTIFEPLALDMNIIDTDISCFGFSDGALSSSVIGGIAPYIFSWDGPNLYTSNLSSIDNLESGSYILTITDDNGCEDTVSSLINEPIALSFVVNVNNPSCYNDVNGIINIQITGGTQPYDATYISGVNTYPNNNSIIIIGLGASSDTLYVTDLNGCEEISFINIIEPLELQIDNITEVNPTCYNYTNGSASIVVTGGSLPYSYQLLDNYNSNIGVTSATNGLGDGIYTYIVNDFNGCTDFIQVNIITPDEIEITQLQSCYGSILVEISNFIDNYQIFWDNAPDTVYIDDLSPGTYNATVIDSLGCTKTDSFIVNDPFRFTVYDATCFTVADGSIALENINGGFPPYSLIVNNELVADDIVDEILLNDLSVTNYQLLLTDNGGCTIFDSLLVVDYTGGSNCVNSPIIISPNSDGTNDTWKPAADVNEEISATIYNRWGQIEFFAEENSQILEWDGTTTEGNILPTADYYFVIHFINQHTMPDKTGVITLIR